MNSNVTRDYKRYPSFIDEDTVRLVKNREIRLWETHFLGFIANKVLEIVKSRLFRSDVKDLLLIKRLSFISRSFLGYTADRNAHFLVNGFHPLAVAVREIIVEREDVRVTAV